jgi:sugar phosphate isomerase/epimerase
VTNHLPAVVCSTISVFSRPLDQAFALISETGFDGLEVMVTSDPDSRDAGRIRGLSEDHGLPVLAVHAPFLLMSRRVWGHDPIGKIERAVELALRVGAPVVVVHPPYRWQSAYRRWLDEQSSAAARAWGVRIAVENMFPLRVRGRSLGRFHARQSLEELERFDAVTLDTSHLAVAGLDPVEAIDRLGERLAHVHLSNNAGRGWDSHSPLDEGVLDLGRVLESLAERGYRGAISLEVDLRNHIRDERVVREVLAASVELCRSRLTLPAERDR